MKKQIALLVLIGLFALVNQAFTQNSPLLIPDHISRLRVMDKTVNPGNELPSSVPLNQSVQLRFEETLGSSWYDSQSYGCTQNRFIKNPDGTMIATWTMSQLEDDNFPVRGTGFNYHDGTSWNPEPEEILEQSDRTGWPGICQTADGTIVSIHHSTTGDFRIRSMISNDAGATWSENDITSADPARMLWPRVAAGGPDGNTVHAFAITTPVANGGTPYEGVDGHLLYYRSLDGGNSWETINSIIQGLDSTYVNRIPADAYALDVNGNKVALAVFPDWGDAAVFISQDNGDTWEKTIIDDFPLDNYVTDSGYTPEEINPDGVIVDSVFIQTTDGSGSVLIDDNGMVHAWFGNMWVADVELNDETTEFDLTASGLAYWNQAMGADAHVIIADLVDANENGMLDIDSGEEIANYFLSLTSMPNTGVDVDGNLYCAYSALAEGFFDSNDDQFYRHVYVIKSEDGGATWSAPFDVITPEFIEDLYEFTEAVYPHVPSHNMEGDLDLIFMRDFTPGTNALDEDDLTSNLFNYLTVTNDLVSPTEEVIIARDNELSIFPNPAHQSATLKIKLLESADLDINIIDVAGKVILNINYSNHPNGTHHKTLDTSKLQNGTYFIQLRKEAVVMTQKLIILN